MLRAGGLCKICKPALPVYDDRREVLDQSTRDSICILLSATIAVGILRSYRIHRNNQNCRLFKIAEEIELEGRND